MWTILNCSLSFKVKSPRRSHAPDALLSLLCNNRRTRTATSHAEQPAPRNHFHTPSRHNDAMPRGAGVTTATSQVDEAPLPCKEQYAQRQTMTTWRECQVHLLKKVQCTAWFKYPLLKGKSVLRKPNSSILVASTGESEECVCARACACVCLIERQEMKATTKETNEEGRENNFSQE